MRSLKQILFLLLTVVIITVIAQCVTSPNEPPLPPISEPIANVCLDKIGESTFIYDDQHLKQGDVYRFRYTSTDNCDAKFLGTEFMVSAIDTLCLCETKQVGEAFFVLDSVDVVGSLNIYHFLQGRETYQGVYNNDAVCNRYTSGSFMFHMEVLDTPGRWNLGDTIYLGFN